VLSLASVTDSLVTFATHVIRDLGLGGVFVLMLLESACIPIPSEATMLFAGFNVADGRFTLLEITVVGVLGNLVGSWIAYWVGRAGRLELLERHRVFHVSPDRLAQADRWFERWGGWAVFFSRLLPVVRTFISLPAGVARMPFWRFTALTIAGCAPFVFLLGFAGKQAGGNWKHWRHSLEYVDYVMAAAIVAGIAWLVYRGVQRRRQARAESAVDVAR